MTQQQHNCLLSIATYSHLPRAFVLAESFLSHNPHCDVLILTPDLSPKKIKSAEWGAGLPVKILGLDDLEEAIVQSMHQYFDAFEMCCAMKSFLLEKALFKYGYEKAVVLDPDIVCYAPFDPVWAALERSNIAVTPHTSSPLPADGYAPDDQEIVNAGFVNGGFWAAAQRGEVKSCVQWIQEKVIHLGFFIPKINLYADQTWMSCLPWFFPEHTVILRNPGLNVAYWNLYERKLAYENGHYICNGERLVFFHFSGYDEEQPEKLTKYKIRVSPSETAEVLGKLLKDYGGRLAKAKKSLPALAPDQACSTLTLQARLQIYERLQGKKLLFEPEISTESTKAIERPFRDRLVQLFGRRR